MRKILATGTSGTIGKHLSKDFQSLRMDLSLPFSTDFSFEIEGDFDLVHMAGVVGEEKVRRDINYSQIVNVKATCELASRFKDSSDGRLLYVSTSHVYAESDGPISEEFKLNPASTYAEQKLSAELCLTSMFRSEPNRLLIVRVFSVLDWGMPQKTLGGSIQDIYTGVANSRVMNADDVRDFLTPKVVARTISSLAQEFKGCGVLNLCSGTGTRVRDAAFRMLESKIESPDKYISRGNSSRPIIVGDNSRLLAHDSKFSLAWTPGLIP